MFDFQTSALDFSVHTGAVFDHNGNEIPGSMAQGAYRNDTGELISINGPNWAPVQHMDVLGPILDEYDEKGYDIHLRAPNKTALYDLIGKQGVFVDIKLDDNGAVMLAEIISGDFIQPTGSSHYMKDGPDTMLMRHRVLNSHNQKYAASVISDYNRVICMNGIVKPDFSARAYGKHTINFNVDGLKRKIAAAAAMMERDAELFGLYATTRLSPTQAMEFLKATFAKLANKADGTPHFSERLLNEILRLFEREDQTVWGLMQAMTYWATHVELKGGSGQISGRLSRDRKVAQTLGSKEFKKLVSA